MVCGLAYFEFRDTYSFCLWLSFKKISLLGSWKIDMMSLTRAGSTVLLTYKRFGMRKVAAPQMWNKPTVCAASHWVSSAPHPWDWVLEGKGCEHELGDGRHGWSISGLFILLFHFNKRIYFEEEEKKGREGKGKKRMKTYLKYETLNSTNCPLLSKGNSS